MPTTLRSHISDLASNFAAAVLGAIRGASLQDILAETSGDAPRRGPGRPRGKTTATHTPTKSAPAKAPAARSRGRLARRSPEDIAKALEQVVALVKSKKGGLRAEQIRAVLKMEAKEMPRVLKEGLAKKQLKSKGHKRSTVYSAA